MRWNIVDGCLVGFIKDDENDNIVPDGVCLRDGKIVSIRFPDGKYAIGKSLCEGIATLETVVIPTGVTEIENSAYLLANSIKKTQKRANALKNIMIPKFEKIIKFITDALEEKEREEFSRLKIIKNNNKK